jgi:NADP+-dependent farnesol dehydrogenase
MRYLSVEYEMLQSVQFETFSTANMEKWRGKIAVVTGGSSGIGAAVVKEFTDAGITTINIDRDEPENKENYFKCDISRLESIKETFKKIEEKFSQIHILINCAGVCYLINTIDTGDDISDKINNLININFTGLVHCTRAAIRLMNKSNDYAYIVNICSTCGYMVPSNFPISIYPSTKFAVRAFSETIRQEFITADNKKIRITNLNPGRTKTNVFRESEHPIAKTMSAADDYLDPKNIAEGILYLLGTPYNVHVTEISIKPVGDTL